MACRLTIEVTGQNVANGLATRLTVLGTASRSCPEVRVTAATSMTSTPIFQGVLTVAYPPLSASNPEDPANDGRFAIDVAAPGNGTACGMPIFVSVECVNDPACRVFAWRSVECKDPGGSGNGDPNDGNGAAAEMTTTMTTTRIGNGRSWIRRRSCAPSGAASSSTCSGPR